MNDILTKNKKNTNNNYFFMDKEAKTKSQSILLEKFGKDETLVSKGNIVLKIARVTRSSFLLRPNTKLQQSN